MSKTADDRFWIAVCARNALLLCWVEFRSQATFASFSRIDITESAIINEEFGDATAIRKATRIHWIDQEALRLFTEGHPN